MEKREQMMSETYVDTMTLHMQPFDKQTVCNGRLRARAKSELTFAGQGIVSDIRVKEGQYVRKGALIASLDKTERTREVEKAVTEALEKNIDSLPDRVGLLATIQYIGCLEQAKAVIESHGKKAVIAEGDRRTCYPGQVLGCDCSSAEIASADVDMFLFVGEGDFRDINTRPLPTMRAALRQVHA